MSRTNGRWYAVLAVVLCAATGCDPVNPCAVGTYDPGPPRACRLPDGGTIFLDEPDAATPDAAVDARVDEPDACANTWYRDADEDGHGSASDSIVACVTPAGYVASSDDCDDDCETCIPGGVEVCDGRDQNCDGAVDGDDLCDFGMGCIDGSCSAIPILEWQVQVEPGPDAGGGEVLDVRVRSAQGSDQVVALLTYRGGVRVGGTLLGGLRRDTTIAMLRFTRDGDLLGETHTIATATSTSPTALVATGFDLDDTGVAWVTGSFTEGANVLGRELGPAGGLSFLVRLSPSGTGIVLRQPAMTYGAIAARSDGVALCGVLRGDLIVGGATLTSDAGGDIVVGLADSGGNLTRGALVRGPGLIDCTGIAARPGSAVAGGTYSGSGLVAGGVALPEGGLQDIWMVSLDDEGGLAWTLTGGSATTADRAGEVGVVGTRFILPTADAGEGMLCGDGPIGEQSVSLVQRGEGPGCTVTRGRLDGEDEFPPTRGFHVPPAGPVPVVAVNLQQQFSDSRLWFGPAMATSTGPTDAVLLGYSSDGTSPAWMAHLAGSETEESDGIAWVDARSIVVGGTFDGSLSLDDAANLSASGTQVNGYIATYRVR